MKIRKLRPKDKDRFRSLDEQIFPHDKIDIEEYPELIQEDGFLGLFADGELIGYLLLRPVNDYGHLNRIGVKPSHQGNNFGTNLMKYALEYFKVKGVEKIGLYVEKSNHTAISLYKKFAFHVEYEAWHYIIPIDDISLYDDNHFDQLSLRVAKFDDIEQIMDKFPSLNRDLLEKWLIGASSGNQYIILEEHGSMRGFARFNPNYSGCMPFKIESTEFLDAFLYLLYESHVREDKDTLRVTFERYRDIADIFDSRGYEQHHHLYYMERSI